MFTLNQIPFESIVYPVGAPEPVRFAAAELQRYLNRSLNVDLPIVEGRPAPRAIFVAVEPRKSSPVMMLGGYNENDYDCALGAAHENCLWLLGENPMAALYAVYDFLQETAGIRFYGPGPGHEYIPPRSSLNLTPAWRMATGSAFALRDGAGILNDTAGLDFAAKNRLNVVMSGRRPDAERWAEIRKRGMRLRGPGHCWRQFIPEEALFASHPEYFPMLGGRRQFNGRTACFSNPQARKIFFEKLRAYVRENRYWDIFAFWAEDVPDAVYCGCPACAKKSLADWYLSLANEAAEIVAREMPGTLFEFIAYHGTRHAPVQAVKFYQDGAGMLFNFCGGYTRDLYHPLAEKTHGSAEVFRMYQNWKKYLRAAGYQGQTMIMDYYNRIELPDLGPRSQAFLWPLDVMREDARFYRKEGLAGVGDFICATPLCWPSPFLVWGWLKLWQNPEISLESLKDDFYPAYFGSAGSAAREYMDGLEAAMDERKMPESIESVQALYPKLLSVIQAAQGDALLEHRLELLRIHHEYSVMLKKIWQALCDGDTAAWKKFETPFRDFIAKTYRDQLKGELDISVQACAWYEWYAERYGGGQKKIDGFEMLR